MRPINDLTGQRFGRLTVIRAAEREKGGRVMWECQCDCGRSVTVRSYSLIKGQTRSCGCIRMNDFTGQRFGKLTALRWTGEVKNSFYVWECRCDCGNIVTVQSGSLQSGNTRSCGCYRKEPRITERNDFRGERFGKLTAVRPLEKRERGYVVWECLCDCGNTVYVRSGLLKEGKTKSCGCLRQQKQKKSDT